ncbi:hypothetical protein [Brevundimonas sp.]|uniref:hypothetical protein n=1 Tax=Brevundimonas sp. TaxID=1871086 RepID=UPI001A1F196A|nr:hypothetical protein [Brevundimonas sp.]MBJ7485967.1 hypothetical protein [Brevundimonas sp.]
MSDTTAGRGGVGIRIFIEGGQVVRRGFDQIADSGKKMWAEIALGQRAANPAIRALSLGVGEAKQGIEGLAGRTGSAGVALSAFGFAGVAAAAAMGGLVIGLGKAREAMAFADEIDDAAQKLAIGTTALQQYRYAMTAVGGSAEDADAAIESFTQKLGEAQAGGRALQWFQRLGFTKEQLAGYSTAEEALDDVIDSVAGLNKETERTAVASKIGLGAMLPLAREGVAAMEELRQRALDIGYTMSEELVKKGADANQQFETMSHIVDVQLKSAFVGLSDEVLTLVQGLVDALDALNDFIERYNVAKRKNDEERQSTSFINNVGRAIGGDFTDNLPWVRNRDRIPSGLSVDAVTASMEELAYPDGRPRRRPGSDLDDPPTDRRSPSSRAASEAERRQRERDSLLDQVTREELAARRATARLRWGGDTAEDRAQMAISMLALDIQERDAKRKALYAQLTQAGAMDDATKLILEEVELLDKESDRLQRRAADEILSEAMAARQLQRETVAAEDAIDLLAIQEQMVGTARERYEAGRLVLLAEQALELKLKEAAARADGLIDEDEQQELASLRRRQDGQVALFDHDEQERLRDQFNSYGREVVQAIEDGRIGEYIGDRIKERLLDGALNALFSMMGNGGGGGKSGGGFLSGLLGFGASLLSGGNPVGVGAAGAFGKTGRAPGGDVRAGFAYRMAEHGPELLMLGGQGQVTSAAETAKMVQDLAGPAGGAGVGGVTVTATYAPNIRVDGSGPEIDALRRQLATEQANFRSNVVQAVSDAQARRQL